MKIPKKFTVGNVAYTVQMKPTLSRGAWGRAWLDSGVILLATHDRSKRPRPLHGNHGVHQTFWHEITHAILYEMGNALYRDEAFVNAFAIKMNQIIETAEF